MKPSEFNISISVKSYDEKTIENYRNYYVDEKRMVLILSKTSIKKKDLNEDCIQISLLCLVYFPGNKPSKSVTVHRFKRFSSLKIVINMYFNFFRLLVKVLELFECRRGNPYITANRDIVRFAHS